MKHLGDEAEVKRLFRCIQTTDVGCKGNALLSRMVGRCVILVPEIRYNAGLKLMMDEMADKL